MTNDGNRDVSLDWRLPSAMWISLVILAGIFSLAEAAWKEDFEAFDAGKPLDGQRDWSGTGAVVVDRVAHSGKKCVQVTPPATGNVYVAVMSRALDEVMAGQDECWVDAWVLTPKTPWLVMTELQRQGKMMSAAGLGVGEGGSDVSGGYLLRTSRGAGITWPRHYAKRANPYTGESFQAKPETWVRLTAHLDLKAKEFEVYQDGKCMFSELEMSATLSDGDMASLIITTLGVKEGTDPSGYVFYVDDCYVGKEKPEGIQKVELYPPRPKEAVLRFAVVGDTQIDTNEGTNTIFNTLGTVIPCVNRLKPDLVLFVGDLINIPKQAEIAYPVWLENIKALQAPYYPVPGNHDPHKFYQQYIRKDLNYCVESNGVTFIAFSSTEPDADDAWDHMGKVNGEQLAWMEKEMQKAVAKKNRIITFTHVTSHENKNPLAGWWIKEGGDALRALYDKYKVFAELSGHQHRWLASWKENDTHYIIVPEVNKFGGIGGMHQGFGVMVYDVLPDKILQYEKPTKMPYLINWGEWAQHELRQ